MKQAQAQAQARAQAQAQAAHLHALHRRIIIRQFPANPERLAAALYQRGQGSACVANTGAQAVAVLLQLRRTGCLLLPHSL